MIERNTLLRVQTFLHENAEALEELARQHHIEYLGDKTSSRSLVIERTQHNHIRVVHELADHLTASEGIQDTARFQQLGERIAQEAVRDGLTIEEAVDGTIFFKQAVWKRLEEEGFLQELTLQDFYHLSQLLGTYTDIVASKIAFAYTHSFTQQVDQWAREQKRAAEEHATLAAIVQSSADAIISLNLDEMITSWNTAAERMYGYTAEEAVGKPITLIIPPERRSEQEEILSKVKKGIHIDHFETVRLRKDGRRVTISLTISPIKDTSGNLLGASKIARDITEQKKAEEQLHFHAAIIHSIHDAVIGTDADVRIISWNQGAQDLYGWKESEVLGKPARDFLHTAFLSPQDEQEWQEALSSKGYWTGEVTQTRKGGTLIPVLTSLAVVKDRKGTILGTVAVNRDITERKQLEQRKDDFIALAAHELRTPVTSLKLVIQALQRRSQQSGDTHSVLSLATVDRQVKKLDELITSLLEVSRVQQGKLEYKKEVFPIDDFLKETVEHVQRVSPSHTIVFEGITNKQVIGDRDRIGQVLINLLTNAMKYSPQANQVIVSVKQKNASVLVSVTDFGIGIQKGQQEKIFDRFFQVNSQTGKTSPGLGLGLYISKEIIEQHHGKLWVESEEGKGAMFSFTLPVFIPENSAEKDAQHG